MLWIGGKAGVGKSALMAKLTDELEDNPELCIVPYFFRYGDGRCTPERFYEAAILKLSAELAIAERYDLREPPQVQFARALKASLQQETGDAQPVIVFLLDGLDEIAERYPDFLRLTLSIQYSGAIWVCAGRDESLLNEIFTTEAVEKLWKNGELPPLREAEVRQMLEQKCDSLLDDFEDKRRQRFIKKLVERCEGLPLYVELVIKELRAGRLTLENLEKLPLGLWDYFDKLLKRFEEEDSWQILCKVLALLVWASRTSNGRKLARNTTNRARRDRQKTNRRSPGFGVAFAETSYYSRRNLGLDSITRIFTSLPPKYAKY